MGHDVTLRAFVIDRRVCVLLLRNLVRTNGVFPALTPLNGKKRRDSSKFCRMFRVTDSERMINDHPTQHSRNMERKWERFDGIFEWQEHDLEGSHF